MAVKIINFFLCSLACFALGGCSWYAEPIKGAFSVGSCNESLHGNSDDEKEDFYESSEIHIKYSSIKIADWFGNKISSSAYTIVKACDREYSLYLKAAYCNGGYYIAIPLGPEIYELEISNINGNVFTRYEDGLKVCYYELVGNNHSHEFSARIQEGNDNKYIPETFLISIYSVPD